MHLATPTTRLSLIRTADPVSASIRKRPQPVRTAIQGAEAGR